MKKGKLYNNICMVHFDCFVPVIEGLRRCTLKRLLTHYI